MSSCYKKNTNIEKYADPPRTPYDQLMNKVYNPQNYYAAPMPMPRTEFDMDMRKHWCPNCKFGFTVTPSKNEKNVLNPATTEFYTSRENYCGGSVAPNNVALALEDNDNVWSYNARNI